MRSMNGCQNGLLYNIILQNILYFKWSLKKKKWNKCWFQDFKSVTPFLYGRVCEWLHPVFEYENDVWVFFTKYVKSPWERNLQNVIRGRSTHIWCVFVCVCVRMCHLSVFYSRVLEEIYARFPYVSFEVEKYDTKLLRCKFKCQFQDFE